MGCAAAVESEREAGECRTAEVSCARIGRRAGEERERTGVGRVERIEPTSTQWDGRVDDVGMSSGWVD